MPFYVSELFFCGMCVVFRKDCGSFQSLLWLQFLLNIWQHFFVCAKIFYYCIETIFFRATNLAFSAIF